MHSADSFLDVVVFYGVDSFAVPILMAVLVLDEVSESGDFFELEFVY